MAYLVPTQTAGGQARTTASPDLGASLVQGTAGISGGIQSPATDANSDPLSTLIAMRNQAISQPKSSVSNGLNGAGLLNPNINFGQNNYTAPTGGGASAPAGASIGAPYQGGAIANPTQFADALLASLGDKVTPANVNSLVNWQGHEGGNWHNTAYYNPLNTTQQLNGSTAMNSVGVQAYKNWADGIAATDQTLRNGLYGDILAALASGNGLGSGSYGGLSKWSGGGYSSI